MTPPTVSLSASVTTTDFAVSTVMVPLAVNAPVPVVNVLLPEMTVFPLRVLVPVLVVNAPVLAERSYAAEPDPAVMAARFAIVVAPVNPVAPGPIVTAPVLDLKIPDPPEKSKADVPVATVTPLSAAKTVAPPMVLTPVVVLKVPVPALKSKFPMPAVLVMPFVAAIVVSPLIATAPVPVANVFEPAITVLPLSVFVPVEVVKAPVERA